MNASGSQHDQEQLVQRRTFLSIAAAATWGMTLQLGGVKAMELLKEPVKLGLIADLHHDLIPDSLQRLQSFAAAAKQEAPAAVIQLGDFALPKQANMEAIKLFNDIHPNSLHVIGNHDTDSGHTKEQCQQFWGITQPYYSANINGLQLIVLDGNEKGSPTHKGGYVSFIAAAQVQWLKTQLEESDSPCVILSHQPLAGPSAIDNASDVQQLLSEHAEKILLAINGHTHIDHMLQVGGVTYLHVNSAAYYWVGGNYRHESYPAEIHAQYKWLSSTCPYRDSLFAFLTIDPINKQVTITGRSTEWVGKSPEELQVPLPEELTFQQHVVPRVSDRAF